MKSNLKKQYIGLLSLLLMLTTAAHAKFTWTMPPVGPGGIGYELASSINIGTISSIQSYSDARDSRDFNSPYGGKGKDICYRFTIYYPTTVIVDSYGSEIPYSNFSLMKAKPGGGVTDMLREFNPNIPLDELPNYYNNSESFRCDVYSLEPGLYYLVHEGGYGNFGAYEGIYVTNLYTFTTGMHLGEFFGTPIPIELTRPNLYYTDIQSAQLFPASFGDPEFPNVIYSFEIHQTSTVEITPPFETHDKSAYYLLDSHITPVTESDDTNRLYLERLSPGKYYIINKALITPGNITAPPEPVPATSLPPSGRIGFNLHIDRDPKDPGHNTALPLDLGIYKSSFSYTKSYQSEHYLTDYYSLDQGPSALYCKIKLLKNMAFECTMTGSYFQKISLLDSNGNLITYEQDAGSRQSKTLTFNYNISHGEYFIKFETDNINHPVNIEVKGTYDAIGTARKLLTLVPTENYILTTTPIVATKSTGTLEQNQVRYSVDYTDGLGRVKQRIDIWDSDGKNDLVQTVAHDTFGRNDSITYLPYVSRNNSGLFRSAPVQEQASFYQAKFTNDADVAYAFATKHYDAAGLAVTETAVGEAGSQHPVRHEYRLNTANEMRRYRVVEPNGLIYSDYYPAGTLQVHCTWQDNLPETIRKYEYTDAQGQKVAVRVQTASVDEFTCNVYDDFGRMRYIVPAIIGDSLSIDKIYRPEELTHYAFYYEYDRYGRQTKAWIPGAEPICQLYDNLGRVAMKQTGNQRTGGKNEWTFVKYDVSGRQIMTGIYIGGNEERHAAALRSQIVLGETRGSAIHGYTNDCYPPVASENDVLSISYYDNYDWLPTTSACVFSQADRLDSNYSSQIIGLSTGSKSKVLGIDEDRWLTSALYYDDEYRTIQSVTELYPGGVEIVSNKHDFIGNVVQTKVKQIIGSQSYEYNKWFDYDTSGRLVAVRQKITNDQLNGEVTVASYTYDDLGRTEGSLIHNGVQTDSHTYRLSGTLVGTTSPSFSYSLGFDRPVAGQSARYDGQIADMAWGYGVDMTQGYRYTYDAKGQMTGAMHAERDVDSWEKKATFNEDGITYDKNGNILTMHRSDIDGRELHNLVYHYNGNRLHSVIRNSEDSEVYTYDADGNMTYDGMRGVGIEYNELNLPERIFAGADEIRYIYSSDGTKLASVANGSFTYYRSVMVYGQGAVSEDEALLYMLQPEGLVTHNGSGEWTYKYFRKDHLGNTRVVLSATQTPSGIELTPEQTTDYYAYGLAWSYNDLHRNRYLYNGKELQDAAIGNLGLLGLYDFGARYYDPMLGRWFNIDPALQLVNPYLYCGNSPMIYVDKDGRWFGIDDLIAALIGGIVNSVAGLISGDIHSVGHFFASFGAGALAGWGTLYAGPVVSGAFLGAANSTLSQGFNNGWNNIQYNSVFFNGVIGGLTGGAASKISGAIAPAMNQITGGIASPVVQQSINQGVTGAATGFLLGTGVAVIQGESFKNAMRAGGRGALFGLTVGTVTGVASGIKYASDNGLNPWTGTQSNREYVNAKDLGLDKTFERIQTGEKFPHRNDGVIFENSGSPRGRGNPILPERSYGYYKEYVHPTPGINGPGMQRIIIGQGGDIYYTPDHYKTFIRIYK